MPETQFTSVTILANRAGIEVTGPYNPKVTAPAKVVGGVMIGFLIIQQDANGDPTIVVDGSTNWKFLPPDQSGNFHGWVGTVEAGDFPSTFVAGKARAIGTAVQVTDFGRDPHAPPVVEMTTWCVEIMVDAQ